MRNGYVRLWRSALESLVWADAKLWRLWSWCLLRAAWKPRAVLLGRRPVELAPGELAATLDELAQATGLSKKEVRSALDLGRRVGALVVQGTAGGMRVGIVNWHEYQHCAGAEAAPNAPVRARRGAPAREAAGQGGGHAPDTPLPYTKKGTREEGANAPAAGAGDEAPGIAGQGRGRSEADADADFERFFALYPKKTARAQALSAWRRTADARPPLEELLDHVRAQAQNASWRREAGRYIPAPATWLLNRRWQDEPDAGARQFSLLERIAAGQEVLPGGNALEPAGEGL